MESKKKQKKKTDLGDDIDDKNNIDKGDSGDNVDNAATVDIEEGLKTRHVDEEGHDRTQIDVEGDIKNVDYNEMVEEGTDDNDFENDETVDDMPNDTLDEEAMDKLLSESIRESLNNSNSEIREAAHRLLRNRMIEVDPISEGDGGLSGSSSASKDDNMPDSTYGAVNTADNNVAEYSAMTLMGSTRTIESTSNEGNRDGEDAVGETTSLLGNKNMGAMNNFG